MPEVLKIDQVVIATRTVLTDTTQPRFKGQKYLIKDVCFCPNTGAQNLNFGYLCESKYKRYKCKAHDNKGLNWSPAEGNFCSAKEWEEMCKKEKSSALDSIVDKLDDEIKKEN